MRPLPGVARLLKKADKILNFYPVDLCGTFSTAKTFIFISHM
jgi:hypothetical protein